MLIVTPTQLFKVLNPIADSLANSETSLLSTAGKKLIDMMTPLLMALVNIVVVPLLVDIVTAFSYKETKSAAVNISLVLNLIYMALNIVFLPLTGIVDYAEFFRELIFVDDFNFVDELTKQMGSTLAFFATYTL